MAKVITMFELLNNPSGKGSAGLARRDIIKENLEERYRKIEKKIKFYCYSDKSSYIFHFLIPSEEFEKLTYDVLLQFSPIGDNSKLKDYTTINKFAVRMYSNSPNFMFTYAYVYNKDGLIIPFAKSKLNEKSLTDAPKVRNPQEMYGYEKSVYFSLLYIKYKELNKKTNLRSPRVFNQKRLLQDIPSSDEKLEERKLLEKRRREKDKKEKAKRNKSVGLNSDGNLKISNKKESIFNKHKIEFHTNKIKKSNAFRVIKPKRKKKKV